MKIVDTPESWYHDAGSEWDDVTCHHGNLYEDCYDCFLEENPDDPNGDEE